MDAARPFAAPCGPAGRIRRGARRALTVGVLVPSVALALAGPALAAVTAVNGSAFGAQVTTTGLVAVSLPAVPTVSIPAAGGTDTDSLATITAPGVLSTGVANVSSIGSIGNGGEVNSFAEIANADLGIAGGLLPALLGDLLTASAIRSDCNSDEGGSTGSTTIADLSVLGNDIDVDGTVNQSVPLTVPLLGNVGTVLINEQITTGSGSSTGITVNAVHITLNVVGLEQANIILAQSVCGVTGDGVGVPVGAIGGVLLTGLVAIGFVGYQLRRRRPGTSRA